MKPKQVKYSGRDNDEEKKKVGKNDQISAIYYYRIVQGPGRIKLRRRSAFVFHSKYYVPYVNIQIAYPYRMHLTASHLSTNTVRFLRLRYQPQ